MIETPHIPDVLIGNVNLGGAEQKTEAADFTPVESRHGNWSQQIHEDRSDHPGLSVVIPAYNEEASVKEALDQIKRDIEGLVDSYQIVVVDDGSNDDTSAVLQILSETSETIRYVSHEINQGKGQALKTGCKAVEGERILFMDADGDLDPTEIEWYLDTMESEDADIVIGSKRHPESKVDYPVTRKILSEGYSIFVRALFRLQVTDTQVGMKLLRRDVVEEIMPLLLVKRYAFDIELLALAKNRGYLIKEAPVSIDFNMGSHMDWLEVAKIGWDTLAVFYRLRLLRYYDRMENTLR